jgi:hypothetical protein
MNTHMPGRGPLRRALRSALLSGMVVATLCSVPLLSHAESDKDRLGEDIVRFDWLGVSFRAPNQWHRPSQENYVENLERYHADEEKKLRDWFESQGTVPIATFHKYDPDRVTGTIPTINIVALLNATRNYEAFLSSVESNRRSFEQVFNNLSWIVEPVEVLVAGTRSVRLVFEYDLTGEDERTYRIRSIIYAIPFNSAFLQVSMVDEVPSKNSELFAEFIGAFRIGED